MRIFIVAGMLLPLVLDGASCLVSYWLGYSESPAALDMDGAFGFGILPIAGFICVCLLAVFALQKGPRVQAILMIIAYWPLIVLFLGVLPTGGTCVVHGLRDRVMHDYSLNDLRRFAQEVNDNHLLASGMILHGDIAGLSSRDQAAFHNLQHHFAFMHWLDDGHILAGPILLNEGDPDEVEFEWGSALSGHWGCSILLDGKRNDPGPGTSFYVLRASDDIYFYFE